MTGDDVEATGRDGEDNNSRDEILRGLGTPWDRPRVAPFTLLTVINRRFTRNHRSWEATYTGIRNGNR